MLQPAYAQRFRTTLLTVATVLALAACAPPANESPILTPTATAVSLPEAVTESPSAAAMALIAAERKASNAGDLATLAQLWTEDARIVDGRATDDASDDYVWQGRDAILDRYVLAVFPAPLPPLDTAELEGLTITSEQDRAYALLGIDRWTLVWLDDRWWLAELRYN